jgi:hypothetical protein
VKCEYDGTRCERKAAYTGYHWGKNFGICAKHKRPASKYYDVENGAPPRFTPPPRHMEGK